jgi:3-methyladenine DNA glycosylase/8-oxoguanine DNA glycosylase
VEQRTIRTLLPVDLGLTLGPLRHGGRADPCLRVGATEAWRTTDTPDGPATVHLHSTAPTVVVATAWGRGASAALARADDLVGADDVAPSLAGVHPVVTELAHRLVGLRIGRTNAVLETLVPVILAQRVIGAEASWAYRAMVRSAGRDAPKPDFVRDPTAFRMLVPPDAGWLAKTPSWAFHGWGVEAKRATTITAAAAHARKLGELPQLPLDEARRCLAAMPGVGPWTTNTVAMLALGDPDAVAVGDYWLKHVVSYALTGEARGTDERMLELLEPWRGQRGRVCRLLMIGAPRVPRFGPRLSLRAIARH